MIVCLCEGVSAREIQEAVAKGASCLEEVSKACSAGLGCGSCHDQIQDIILTQKSVASAALCAIGQAQTPLKRGNLGQGVPYVRIIEKNSY